MQMIPRSFTISIFVTLLLLASACGQPKPEREWTPEDHGQPVQEDLPEAQEPLEAQDEEDPHVRAARALWTVSCAPCHGREGRGDGTGKPPGAQVADLTRSEWQRARSDEEIAQVIREGKGMMPAFADKIVPAGIEALVMHVRSLAQDAAPAAPGAQEAAAPADAKP